MTINEEIKPSRITLTYRTEVEGKTAEVKLPFRVLLMGDFSGKTPAQRAEQGESPDLEDRPIRNFDGRPQGIGKLQSNLDAVMEDMNMSVTLEVKNRINPETPDDPESFTVELPITSMDSFAPATIANEIDKVRALLLLKKLLLEVQAKLDNRKDFRKLLRQLATDKTGALDKLKSELAGFEHFRVPESPKLPQPSTKLIGKPKARSEAEPSAGPVIADGADPGGTDPSSLH